MFHNIVSKKNDFNMIKLRVEVHKPAKTSVDSDEIIAEMQRNAIVRSSLIRDQFARLIYFYNNHCCCFLKLNIFIYFVCILNTSLNTSIKAFLFQIKYFYFNLNKGIRKKKSDEETWWFPK